MLLGFLFRWFQKLMTLVTAGKLIHHVQMLVDQPIMTMTCQSHQNVPTYLVVPRLCGMRTPVYL